MEAKIHELYKKIDHLDQEIVYLEQRKQKLIQKFCKTEHLKKADQYLELIEDIIDNILVLQKKKKVMIQILSTLTPMAEINILQDSYIGDVIQAGGIDKDDITSHYLYGCISYGYTIFSNNRIPTIDRKISLEEFERINTEEKTRKNNSHR